MGTEAKPSSVRPNLAIAAALIVPGLEANLQVMNTCRIEVFEFKLATTEVDAPPVHAIVKSPALKGQIDHFYHLAAVGAGTMNRGLTCRHKITPITRNSSPSTTRF